MNYIKWSYFNIQIYLNPFVWFRSPFVWMYSTESDSDPGCLFWLDVKILFLKISVMIDDGRW